MHWLLYFTFMHKHIKKNEQKFYQSTRTLYFRLNNSVHSILGERLPELKITLTNGYFFLYEIALCVHVHK